MRLAVLSDIHGNVHALDSVLADLEKHPADALVCLGDAIQGGAQPAETFTRALNTAWNDRPAPQLIADGDSCGPDGCAVPTAESAVAD